MSEQSKREIKMLKEAISSVRNGGQILELRFKTVMGSTVRYWLPKKKSVRGANL